METPQPHTSENSRVPRFDSSELAQRIVEINGGESRTVTVEMIGREDVKEWIDGLNELRTQPVRSGGLRCKMGQSDDQKDIKSLGQTLAEKIAAIHGTVPTTITGRKFDPAVAELLRKSQIARSVPPSDTFRCKEQNVA